MLTPVDNPTRLRAGRDRRRRATSSGSSRSRSQTRSPATRSTPASTCSSRTPSIAFRRTRRGRSSAASSRRSSSAARRSSPTSTDGYWIDIGTPEKYMQVHRDIMDGRYQAPPFAGAPPATAWIVARRARRGGRRDRRPVLHRRRRRSSRPARAIGPTRVDRPADATSRKARVIDGVDRLAERPDRPEAVVRRRSSAATATSAATSTLDDRRGARRQDRASPTTADV